MISRRIFSMKLDNTLHYFACSNDIFKTEEVKVRLHFFLQAIDSFRSCTAYVHEIVNNGLVLIKLTDSTINSSFFKNKLWCSKIKRYDITAPIDLVTINDTPWRQKASAWMTCGTLTGQRNRLYSQLILYSTIRKSTIYKNLLAMNRRCKIT